MNHDVLKSVIFDQHEVIRAARIVPRRYELDPQANYVITGLRRAGKSTILYKVALDLVASGVDWTRIVYVNFEDERLAEFGIGDFNDIVLVQRELSQERGFFFFDEIQNVPGWEKFARRLADAGERVYLTGSNAKMLGSQMASTLGGRYLTKHVSPYRFDEYLDAVGQPHDAPALYASSGAGAIAARFESFCLNGGFPESLRYAAPRAYVESVYQKVLLGDVVARNNVRNPQLLRVLVKKIAETVGEEASFSSLHGMLKGVGFSASKDTIIDYVALSCDAYLLFSISNATAKFVEREGSPKYYFSDNGLISLFLDKNDSALLENEIAVALRDAFGDNLHYLKSRTTGIDVDFYVPEAELAVQVARSLSDSARKREVGNLVKLAKVDENAKRLVIVTQSESGAIEEDGVPIEVKPAWKFVLQDLIG
ncbi:ATP-binding protein [Adlercreutzia sp. ZJ242]|uniref:ATP-binding protein n=1 Tax=Adlercreutzia sp. ZJ242 TaxID=2709409 RepID=UPI0013EA8719|nr:ATP-binding protein [Adlercreutzia sp. ZJ242]